MLARGAPLLGDLYDEVSLFGLGRCFVCRRRGTTFGASGGNRNREVSFRRSRLPIGKPGLRSDPLPRLRIYANYDFGRYLGATAEFDFPTASTTDAVFKEHDYLFGARGLYHKRRFTPYIKFLVGAATSTPRSGYTLINAPDTFPVAAFGGGVEYRWEHHITFRVVDFEQQEWLAYHPSGLTPTIFSFGAAYRFNHE